MTESAVQAKCIKLLDSFGYVTAKIVVANKGGVLDIIACSPKGRYLEIEVKFGANKMSKLQEMRQAQVLKNNGVSFTVYTEEELIANLKAYGLEREPVVNTYRPSKPLL